MPAFERRVPSDFPSTPRPHWVNRAARAVGSAAFASLAVAAGALGQSAIPVSVHNPAKAYPGLNVWVSQQVFIYDMNGAVLKRFQDPFPGWRYAELVKPLGQGRLLALTFDWNLRMQNPHPKKLVEVDWNGNVLWEFDPVPMNHHLHHDFERLPNGNTIAMTQTLVNPPAWPIAFWDDVLFEVEPGGNIAWRWSMAEHAGQLPLTAEQWSYVRRAFGQTVFHMNAVQALPRNKWQHEFAAFTPGNLLISLRNLNTCFIIDKATGNIVWSYTGAIAQHHPRMIQDDLPGGGNILIFDNGGNQGAPPIWRSYSRVIEINPVTQKVVWSYECPLTCPAPQDPGGPQQSFYTAIMGGAQRLPNGNTLITESDGARAFEVTPQKEIVWQANTTRISYRAYRFPANWPTREIPLFAW